VSFLCLIVLLFTAFQPLLQLDVHAQGLEIFVSSVGSGNDCTQNDPCLWTEAIFKANNGDVIYFEGGDNGEYLIGLASTILIEKALILRGGWDGAPTGDLVIDPSAYPTILNGGDESQLIRVNVTSDPNNVLISGFLIRDGYDSLFGGGVKIDNGQVTLEDNEFIDNISGSGGGGIYSESPDAVTIINSLFIGNVAENNGGAIYIDPENDPEIKIIGNFFDQNQSPTGAAIRTARVGVVIQKNEIYNSHGYSAVLIGYPSYLLNTIEISNNIIAHVYDDDTPARAIIFEAANGVTHQILNNTIVDVGRGIEASSGTTLLVTNNIFSNCSVSISNSTGNFSGTNNLFYSNGSDPETLTNPLNDVDSPWFVDTSNDDYHIKEGSPAQNTGANVNLTDDIDGEPRPRGGGYDIGADEIQSGFMNFLPLIIR